MAKKINPKDEKIVELTADLQRMHAEFVNYKNRSEKEKLDAINIGKEHIVEELLPVIDSLYLAFDHTPEQLQTDPWVKGVIGLNKQLTSVLQAIGLERIETLGQVFNHETMEAVSAEDGEGEAIVVNEFRPGYKYCGKVIRPAMVQVKK
jgi:molecular chaperone GrpE